MNDWLANLKVGDKIVVGGGGRIRVFLSTVRRLTKTRIFTTGDGAFGRDGYSPGQWATTYLLEPTPENLEEVRQEALRVRRCQVAYQLREYAWQKLPLETLEAIKALLRRLT